MKIYISAPVPHQSSARNFADCLVHRGHEIVSRWLYQDNIDYDGDKIRLGRMAVKDLKEVMSAELFIMISQDGSSGGMHAELGIALCSEIPILAWGKKISVFSYHPSIRWFRHPEPLLGSIDPVIGNMA